MALGAFGAHALRERIPAELMAAYQTGIQYQALHTISVLVIGLLLLHLPASRWIRRSGWLMLLGTLLFSGSLYLMAISGFKSLGAITPLGGICLLAGWFSLIVGLIKRDTTI
ncbi:MAG: DUF423 domain-containing protein [Sedimenticola sp.]|nr:DUF423 domain-containing protein [Sedimenticola sp.]MCW8946126.1 DUF423 domain-containing protein [Sedimenticola sp.]MCW8948582.1 DUF423 domain-containing protein [Sedimenticola sp.]MCW8977062.1 DUF423 domain-containing protein [Sedimenticola sp.]